MCVGSNSMTSGPAIDDVLTFAEAGRIDDAHRVVSQTLGFMFGGVLPMRAVPTSCPAAASDGDEGYPGTVDVPLPHPIYRPLISDQHDSG